MTGHCDTAALKQEPLSFMEFLEGLRGTAVL